MKRRSKIILAGIGGVILILVAVGLYALYTLRRIPEAYAAWDTGTLLVEYLQQHDDRWPASWEDLVGLVRQDSQKRILLRGASAGDVAYAESLRNTVRVEWAYDPNQHTTQTPITRPDGQPFTMLWDDPNAMVRAHLANRATTRPKS